MVAGRTAPANRLAGAFPAHSPLVSDAGTPRAAGRRLRRCRLGRRIRPDRRHPARAPGFEPFTARAGPARGTGPARLAGRGHALPGMQRRAEPPAPNLSFRRDRRHRILLAPVTRTENRKNNSSIWVASKVSWCSIRARSMGWGWVGGRHFAATVGGVEESGKYGCAAQEGRARPGTAAAPGHGVRRRLPEWRA